jgi:hypothetical protein
MHIVDENGKGFELRKKRKIRSEKLKLRVGVLLGSTPCMLLYIVSAMLFHGGGTCLALEKHPFGRPVAKRNAHWLLKHHSLISDKSK